MSVEAARPSQDGGVAAVLAEAGEEGGGSGEGKREAVAGTVGGGPRLVWMQVGRETMRGLGLGEGGVCEMA